MSQGSFRKIILKQGDKIMNNFVYHNPVKIVFGKGTISELSNLLPKDKKILMLYGGGSIKKNGVYDQVSKALEGFDWLEFSGIEPNPLHETCMKVVELIKKENVDFLLSVGGGSVLDATKYIAMAALYTATKDPWDMLKTGNHGTSALPLGCVLTLPATGSEMNAAAVISRKSTIEKLPLINAMLFPQFSILDPETTYSLPVAQTINGIVDTFMHVLEQYANTPVNAPLQDRQAEGIMLTLVEEAPKVLANPFDYDARANIMWAAANALSGTADEYDSLIACGVVQDWSTHMIGHELTAFYGLDHAQTLAIILPSLWRQRFEEKEAKLAQLARRVYGITESSNSKAAEMAITKTEEFFHSIGMKTRLSDYSVDATEAAKKVASRIDQPDIEKIILGAS